MRSLLAVAVIVACSPAFAATLPADSLVCDDLADLRAANDAGITGKGGAEALRQARLMAEFYGLQQRAAGVRRDLIAVEPGRSTVRGAAEDQNGAAAGDKATTFRRIAAGCAVVAADQPAVVLERKGVSGAARVRTSVRGAEADVWVDRVAD